MNSLEARFDKQMVGIYHRAASECGYRPAELLRMVHDRGGLAAAKALINRKNPSDGFTRLWELGRLDLAVEALVIQEPWCALFLEEELAQAKKRLGEYGYHP